MHRYQTDKLKITIDAIPFPLVRQNNGTNNSDYGAKV
jgi:hypothetical protein